MIAKHVKSQQLSTVPRGYPITIERTYAQNLRGIMMRLHRDVMQSLASYVAHSRQYRIDADIPDGVIVAVQQVAIERAILTASELAMITATAAKIDASAGRYIKSEVHLSTYPGISQVEAFGGVSEATTSQWISENVRLIQSVRGEYLDQVGGIIADAQIQGATIETLADEIEGRYGVARSRANLIARTETAKLNSAISAEKATAIGISEYKWMSSGDQRVRSSHRVLDGQIFSYAGSTPIGLHPGQDFQCRCIARPVVPDWMNDA